MGRFPSGQRGQTVNLLAPPSKVRILLSPKGANAYAFSTLFLYLVCPMSEIFYADGLHFECQQCSHCCRHEPGFVYLSTADLSNLCRYFNMNESAFIKQYCRWVPYYDNTEVLCLLEKTDYDCIFWNKGCTVYQARPLQCSTYPFWDHILVNKRTWESERADCPGIGKGGLHSFSEIKQKLLLNEKNEPIHRVSSLKEFC